MFEYSIWASAILLEILLIARSVRGDYFKQYPFFYSYISFVLLQSLARFAVYRLIPDWYRSVYWFTEFAGIIAGCLVVFEFCLLGLKGYPGVARLARAGLLAAFLFTFSKVLFTAAEGKDGWTPALTFLLERDVRFVQIAGILTLMTIVLVYRIPMSRNLKGTILGYGLYLALVVTNLTFLGLFGERVQMIVTRAQSVAYFIALVIWNIALWSYRSLPERLVQEQQSYASLYEHTNDQLGQARGTVERVLP